MMPLAGPAVVHAGGFQEAAWCKLGGYFLLRGDLKFSFARPEAQMAYTAILKRIRLLIPAKFDGHYEAVRRGFEAGDLTAPCLSISDMQLARAISEFTGYPPNEASIATLERRLNPQY